MSVIKKVMQKGRRVLRRVRVEMIRIAESVSPPSHNSFPIPGVKLRVKTTLNWFDVESHIQGGIKLAELVKQKVQAAGMASDSLSGVLDFGCGGGRVLRHLRQVWPNAKLFGSDVDEELIAWAKDNLSGLATWQRNTFNPPMDLEANSLNVIYLFSVFTHIDAPTQLKWLEEFHRILQPNGLVLLTIVAVTEEFVEQYQWDDYDPAGIAYTRRTNEKAGRLWVDRETDLDSYIDVKQTEKYCRQEFSKWFDIEGVEPNVNDGQTLLLLKKRS
jgi:SAM-dependent methyltransferase